MSIAVVIPLFNHGRFIATAIESVTGQSRPVDKIVVVDDGSTDDSVEVVRRMGDARIALFTQENAGAHNALNRAILEAKDCEFIAILNSDDVYHPQRIEKCVSFLESNPGHDVVCTNVSAIDGADRVLGSDAPQTRWIEHVWNRRCELPAWLGIANFAKTSSNFVARTAWLLEHPFRDYRYVHDYFFALETVFARKLGVLDERLLFYRIHGTNTIKSDGAANVRREVVQMNLDFLRELAPRMKTSADVRRDYAEYFRMLAGNHADFRVEVFLSLLAQIVAQDTPESLEELVAGLNARDFSELTQPSSKALKDADKLKNSTWMRLGRSLGFLHD